jgi:archaeosine-15-forming tRNA-guanine transglycosylase
LKIVVDGVQVSTNSKRKKVEISDDNGSTLVLRITDGYVTLTHLGAGRLPRQTYYGSIDLATGEGAEGFPMARVQPTGMTLEIQVSDSE